MFPGRSPFPPQELIQPPQQPTLAGAPQPTVPPSPIGPGPNPAVPSPKPEIGPRAAPMGSAGGLGGEQADDQGGGFMGKWGPLLAALSPGLGLALGGGKGAAVGALGPIGFLLHDMMNKRKKGRDMRRQEPLGSAQPGAGYQPNM